MGRSRQNITSKYYYNIFAVVSNIFCRGTIWAVQGRILHPNIITIYLQRYQIFSAVAHYGPFKAGRVGKLVHDLVNLIEVLDIVIAILKGGRFLWCIILQFLRKKSVGFYKWVFVVVSIGFSGKLSPYRGDLQPDPSVSASVTSQYLENTWIPVSFSDCLVEFLLHFPM